MAGEEGKAAGSQSESRGCCTEGERFAQDSYPTLAVEWMTWRSKSRLETPVGS